MNPQISELPNGEWVITDDTHISKWSREWGTIKCDPALFEVLAPWLSGVEVVWDIGACIGDHSRFYLDLGKTVVSVEPNPLAFECLSHNCPEAILTNAAASDKVGTLRFSSLDNAGASRITKDGAIEVPAVRMDDFDYPAPDFVKIDVEGWEYDAISGMLETLQAHHPTMFIEINAAALAANGRKASDITDLLRGLGYTQFQIHPPSSGWDDLQFDIFATQ